MYRTLVVGEGPEECQALVARLSALGFDSSSAPFESVSALRGIFAAKPDVVIFDADGEPSPRELFGMLLEVSQLPVLVIGSALDSDDLVWYLDAGAAAYVVKPVGASVIAARVNSVLRRRREVCSTSVQRFGNITIDSDRREVRKNGQPVLLTPTEFHLLEVLIRNVDRPCSRRSLLQQVWGEDFLGCTHYLRLYVGYLRSKLEDDPRCPRLLLTEWGHGYRLVSEPESGRVQRASPAVTVAQA